MRVNFDSYTFHIQGSDNGRNLICITSEKEFAGVNVEESMPKYVVEAAKHSFFTKRLYDYSDLYDGENSLYEVAGAEGIKRYKKYNYNIFKNIISDILSTAGGYEFLQGLMRYLENDKVTSYINRAIGEVKVNK